MAMKVPSYLTNMEIEEIIHEPLLVHCLPADTIVATIKELRYALRLSQIARHHLSHDKGPVIDCPATSCVQVGELLGGW